ncbi:uncharacterized protein [Physcomitrium patens]|uniref:uncharacterized protein isoform X3 n=1 Tax=Physcomitrium patens TaxID=3218 RepID=UPI000D1783FB|nr:uncharacterized protein LOC112291172 isoform X3 [Physcomitrium patens]|eukprot:XP_024394056.1 uncharacterized protein LOC112291172 isoform X3 [Physcomitrella patens]
MWSLFHLLLQMMGFRTQVISNLLCTGLEAGTNNKRCERKAGKGRRRRQAAEQRRIEQQRWGQYVEDEDEDFSVVVPSPSNLRRRARRSLRRNSARDDLEEYLNGLANDDHITGVDGDQDLDLALALSFSLAEQTSTTHVAQFGRSNPSSIADMSYEGEYEHGDLQVNLPCHHGFHQACGAEWLLSYSKLCPVCKYDVTEVATTEASSSM